jgi:hypothetical protein
MRLPKNRLLLIWCCLCSAAVTIIARLLNATDIGFDFPSQIQAAQHLLAGRGLTIYAWAIQGDLGGRARLLTMAHFPAGYSLGAAALIAMGFTIAAIVKTFGAVATILGWWGWAELGFRFLSGGLNRGIVWRWAGYAIVFALPLISTPPWQDTEIFLWAAIPWVLRWVTRAAHDDAFSRQGDWMAGVLCGFSILMNYAAVFLLLYALFLILGQSKTSPIRWRKRIISFAPGAIPFIALQIYINHFISETESTAGSITVAGGLPRVIERLWQGLGLLSAANLTIAWWMPHQLLTWLTRPNNPALIGATLGVFLLLPKFVAAKIGYRGFVTGVVDLRVAAAGLFGLLPIFLWGWTGVSDYLFVADSKYYILLLALPVFIGYVFALPNGARENKMQKLLRGVGAGYSAAFVFVSAIWVLLLVVPGDSGSGKRAKLMGTTRLDHWPSMKVSYEFSAARTYAIDLLRQQPDTAVVTNHEEWFYADPEVDRSRITRLKDFRATYIDGPAHLLLVAEDFSGGPLEGVSWYTHYGKLMVADFFQHVPDLRLLKRFPEENVKILEAWIPAGKRVPLTNNARELVK